MRRLLLAAGAALGFVATLALASSGLVGCDDPEIVHVELEPGTFIIVFTDEQVIARIGLSSARLTWGGEEAPVVIEYTSADDGARYRAEYTVIDVLAPDRHNCPCR